MAQPGERTRKWKLVQQYDFIVGYWYELRNETT